ncbi:MAG: hypothetical protein BM555_07110 [Crocinitomix sp. MedPE-SWsnd]|jgi:hypothetical protein|nr:MAG: hypothetical protein BM555_07110 [Crocinitomix sp. MedPE-SWsnd]
MKRLLFALIGFALLSSCLKKLPEVESANTNIFDTAYAGERWFVVEDVYLYTTNNTQYVEVEYKIPQSFAPDLSPTGIMVEGNCNDYDSQLDSAIIGSDGSYYGGFNYQYDGSTNFCLEAGVFIRELDYSINKFTECADL